ncbi:hypothetical protein KGQ34_03130 [Patescibacteria group bacterium]|nr:hypothetical protein [Patescibacteria group bacterium]
MRREWHVVIFGALFCFGIMGNAASADARMFFRRDPRPRLLIAVRDESLALQNKIIDDFCLVRFENKKMLGEYLRNPEKFFEGKSCAFVPRMHRMVLVQPEFFYFANESNHYALLSARNFMVMLGKAFYGQFHVKLKMTDTVRVRKEQDVLVRQNKTKADGQTHDRQSAHLSGAAFDISRLGLTRQQNRWIELKLELYIKQEKIVAVEEIYNNAFHVFVRPDWENK